MSDSTTKSSRDTGPHTGSIPVTTASIPIGMRARWGMVGIGRLADASIAPAIAEAQNSELIAVCSRDAQRADAFAEKHGAGYAFDDFSEMLEGDLVDTVYISSPNAVHYEQALAALRAGKNVLVDKPMALSEQEGRALVAAADDAAVRLGVGFQLRHKATNVTARAAIAEGRIGAPAHFQLMVGAGKSAFRYDTWRSDSSLAGGGTLLNQGAHGFDLVEFLNDSRISEVVSFSSGESSGLEEVFVAAVRLENGAFATIACDQVTHGTPRTWIGVGTEGWLEGRGAVGAAADDELTLHRDGEATELASSPRGAYLQEVADFAAAVTGTGTFSGDGRDGLRSILLVETLYAAARDGHSRAVPQV
jgi:1,5-anhydro-D-fructose reductase (1,5-anhydro-D-mannitol-forming)